MGVRNWHRLARSWPHTHNRMQWSAWEGQAGLCPELPESHAAPDCLQRPLRCGFRQQVSASVRLQWKAEGRHEAD